VASDTGRAAYPVRGLAPAWHRAVFDDGAAGFQVLFVSSDAAGPNLGSAGSALFPGYTRLPQLCPEGA
jgi:hypothetical protein